MYIRKIPKLNNSDKLRFLTKILFSINCWDWKGEINDGYGYFILKGKKYKAHRVAYEHFNIKKLPTNKVIDHLCRNRKCVNPEHLEVVTSEENILRGNGLPAINKRKIKCKRGHHLSGENISKSFKSGRYCLACGRIRAKIFYSKSRTS